VFVTNCRATVEVVEVNEDVSVIQASQMHLAPTTTMAPTGQMSLLSRHRWWSHCASW
jgi:hypothetical protein